MNFEDSFNQGGETKQNSCPVHSCLLDMFNPGGYFWEFLVRLCRPVSSPNPDPISHPFSDLACKNTRFWSWPLRNYVIIT